MQSPCTLSDPDIVSCDGIYNRYLGHYLDAAHYRFNILVDNNDNNAFYVLEDKKQKSATRTNFSTFWKVVCSSSFLRFISQIH